MMIFSIIGCLKSLLWVAMTLGLMWLVFAIVFCSATSDFMDDSAKYSQDANIGLVEHFGTVGRAMVTLFMAMSGGNDWGMYYDAIQVAGRIYAGLFLFYIILAIFAVVNIVTGVFVDSAIESGKHDMDMKVAEELETQAETLQNLQTLFRELTVHDDDGLLSLEEFEKALENVNVVAFFKLLKLDFEQAKDVYSLLDYDQSGQVDIEEFVHGCYNLLGEATVFDQRLVQSEVHFLKGAVCRLGLEVNHITQLLENLQPKEQQHAYRNMRKKTTMAKVTKVVNLKSNSSHLAAKSTEWK